MSEARPTVCPKLVASLIQATPDRVRRRLDRTPDAAAAWAWQISETVWSVEAGGETVTLPRTHILTLEQVRCTCLLAPQCFHILACLTGLQVVLGEPAATSESPASEAAAEDEESVQPSEAQRGAAEELVGSVDQLLRVGAVNAGVVVQSGLLRAVHQCRAEGLHRLASLGLRLAAGTSELRARAPESDPAQLAEDLADALLTGHHLRRGQAVASFWVGTARRKQRPVRPRRLHGLFAEPILTRSGYAGAAAYLLGEDDAIYTASDVRPGDAQLARDAYHGGIELGPMVQPARQLARGLYLGTDLTASRDGRLGRGKDIKIVDQGTSTWQAEAIRRRFARPLPEQWDAVYAQAALPEDARSAGWDLLFLSGTVLGAVGPELLFQPDGWPAPMRLAIANDSDALCYRANLRMLSHAPGLPLDLIARMTLLDPMLAVPLAAAPREDAGADAPHLDLPKELGGRLSLGFDEIKRNWLHRAQHAPVVLAEALASDGHDHPLRGLKRRWIASMLSGLTTQRPTSANTLGAEMAYLDRAGFTTGAALLDALTRAGEHTPSDLFLATATYLRTCQYELARPAASTGE